MDDDHNEAENADIAALEDMAAKFDWMLARGGSQGNDFNPVSQRARAAIRALRVANTPA